MTEASLADYVELKNSLVEMNDQGGFIISVLTDNIGLPIASSSKDMDEADIQAAVVAQVQKLIVQIKPQLEMSNLAEFLLNDVNGKRLICRSFLIGDSEMTLAVLMDGIDKPYRRITSRAINRIKNFWMNS